MPLPCSAAEIARRWAAIRKHDTIAAAALELGIKRGTLTQWISDNAPPDPAIQASMDAVNTRLIPALAWAKTKSADGTSYSVLLKPQSDAPAMLDRIKAAFEDLTPAAVIAPPLYADSDLLTLYPLADVHLGMMAWGRETGEDYDTKTAATRMQSWIGQCIASSPASETAIILGAGDLLHADDQTNMTPRSKHVLDVDTRHFKTLEVAIGAFAACIELALAKHRLVKVVILPGNHDSMSYMAVMFALAERYRLNERVAVRKEPGEFFVEEFGAVLIASHHGDKAPPERLVLTMSDEYAPAWGRTRHRTLFTGHLH